MKKNAIVRLWAWMNGTAIRDRVANTPEAEAHRDFARNFTPVAGVTYEWFLSQAVKEFELTDSRTGELDKKADSLIGYLGAASGVLSLTMVYVVNAKHSWLMLISVPATLIFLTAVFFAVVSRSPALHPSFPATEDFLLKRPDAHYSIFAARVAASAQIARMAIKEKAKLVRRSYWCFNLGLVWLVFGSLLYSLFKILRGL
jgi:hypothetical protein